MGEMGGNDWEMGRIGGWGWENEREGLGKDAGKGRETECLGGRTLPTARPRGGRRREAEGPRKGRGAFAKMKKAAGGGW